MTGFSGKSGTALALVMVLGLAACNGGGERSGGIFGPRETRAQTSNQALSPPQPDGRGVVTYASYQVMVAQEGDTVASMAQRVGLTPAELARHNGLPQSYSPRPGEVLALPRNVGGTPVNASIWSTEIAASAIDSAGTSGIATQPVQQQRVVTSSVDNPFNNGQNAPVIDPVRHRVQPGETAFSIARRYGVSVTALASWNGLDNDMTLRENQEILIPVVDGTGRLRQASAVPAPAPSSTANAPGTPSAVAPPPSAAAPLPENQDVREATPPPSPNLAEDRSPPPSTPMSMPVAGASVLRGYEPGGSNGNEGVDLAAPAGTTVKAAESGTVALISESRGGLGTIVLVRHPDNLMTVYGRITGVTLEKGDTVSRGQKIGVIADGKPSNLHFEVRRGTASVDPAPFLGL